MSESRFNSPEELESEHVSQAEVAEVVRIWSEKQKGVSHEIGASSVSDVAEGLDISPDLARALIKEVREGKAAFRELPVSARAPKPVDAMTFVSLGLLGAALLAALGGVGGVFLTLTIGLIVSLMFSKRWALAAIACFLVLGGGLFFLRSSADRSGIAATIEAPPLPSPPPIPTGEPPTLPIPPPIPGGSN